MKNTFLGMFGAAGVVCGANIALAQWVTFNDETGTRLVLTEVTLGDPEEKDIWAADFNNDGWTDLVVVRKAPFSNPGPRVDLLLMNENGVLTDRTATLANDFLFNISDARDVVVSDFDNDGWLDIFVVSTFGVQPQYYANLGNNALGVWQGFADQSATRLPTLTVLPLQMCAGWAGDLDGNGFNDVYMTNYAPIGGAPDVLLMNQGGGVFLDQSVARLGNLRNSAFGTGVEMRDLDNDGDLDITKTSSLYSVAPWNAIGIFSLFNDGTGNFNWTGMQLGGGDPYMFTVADISGDGKFDVYAMKDSQDTVNIATTIVPNVDVTYNTTALSSSPRTTGFGGNTKAADIDGDGDLDMGVAPIDVDIQNCGTSGGFALLRNPGNGLLVDPFSPAPNINVQAHDFHFIDINNDGCLDLFMGLCTGYKVFIQDSPACFIAPGVGDFNGDGVVNAADLAILLGSWGGAGIADLNNDGTTDASDLAILLGNWG